MPRAQKQKLFIPCLHCAKPFKRRVDLKKHQKLAYHFVGPYGDKWTEKGTQQKYFDAFYENYALVLRNDQRKSRRIVQRYLKKVSKRLDAKNDLKVNFWGSQIEPAGSTATTTKVHVADEYDFNLAIKCPSVSVDDKVDVRVMQSVSVCFAVQE